MPAGIKYNLTPPVSVEEFCRMETIFRHSGGFNLEDAALPAGSYLPVLCPLSVDFKTRKAVAVKNVKVVEDAGTSATVIKIQKGSLAYVGMFVGTGVAGASVTAIDKTNKDYDSLTVNAALGVAVVKDQVLFEATSSGGDVPKYKANKLNYAHVKVEAGATVTAIGVAYEIYEHKLVAPVSEGDKVSLGANFMFVY
jgi:hypothetical protein